MTTPERFQPWRLAWRQENVARFWDWYSGRSESSARYFSRAVGGRVLAVARRTLPISTPVVEVGAAGGDFIGHLLNAGIDAIATDASGASVEAIERQFVGRPHFLGAHGNADGRLPLGDQSVGTVFLLETVEHLEDDVLRELLRDVHRILRPGGGLFVTTPNAEELGRNETMCPNCGCVFHTVQHVRSWTATTLGECMASAGFDAIACKATLFSSMPPGLRTAHRLYWQLRRGTLPHLYFAGWKR